MALALQTGLRISEILGLDCGDVVLGLAGRTSPERRLNGGRARRSIRGR
jgi:integrase